MPELVAPHQTTDLCSIFIASRHSPLNYLQVLVTNSQKWLLVPFLVLPGKFVAQLLFNWYRAHAIAEERNVWCGCVEDDVQSGTLKWIAFSRDSTADQFDFLYYSFVARENRVPYYQRLFQQHDGKRQWWKVSPIPNNDHTQLPILNSADHIILQTKRSGALLWPYYISLWGTTAGTPTQTTTRHSMLRANYIHSSHHIRHDPYHSCKTPPNSAGKYNTES